MPCQTAASAAEGADALLLMVVNADQAEQVLFADGAAQALGAGKLVVLMATCPPDRVKAIGQRLSAMGIDFPRRAGLRRRRGREAGTLTIMAGGPKAIFDRRSRSSPISATSSGMSVLTTATAPR